MKKLEGVINKLGQKETKLFMEVRDRDEAYIVTPETKAQLPPSAKEMEYNFDMEVTFLNDIATIRDALGDPSESGYIILESEKGEGKLFKIVKEDTLSTTYFDDFQYEGESWLPLTQDFIMYFHTPGEFEDWYAEFHEEDEDEPEEPHAYDRPGIREHGEIWHMKQKDGLLEAIIIGSPPKREEGCTYKRISPEEYIDLKNKHPYMPVYDYD